MIQITNIHQLLPFVEKKPEFVVIDKGDYKVIDYVYQDENTFEYPELLECRGIKFDRDGLIIARPFRKFFNYGEKDSVFPVHRTHYVTEKLDGSMIHPVVIDKKLYLHTRKGHTDVALKAERFMLSSTRRYSNFCISMINAGVTPIFEYVGPDNRIVLRYEESSLVLLACRHMINGNIFDYRDMERLAEKHYIPVVKWAYPPISDVKGFVKKTRELKEAEGYVVYFDDGYMIKVKAEDYVLKHRALDDLGSKKKVVALCCQGFMDDVIPILSPEDARELIEFNVELQEEVTKYTVWAEGLATTFKNNRKEFALEVVPRLTPKWLAGVVFGIMDGKDARILVLKAIEKNVDDIQTRWRGQ